MHLHAIKLNLLRFIIIYELKSVSRSRKRQVCFRIEESLVQEMEHVRDLTGVPVSTQIEMRLKGFTIQQIGKKQSSSDILKWYKGLEKDEDLAVNIENGVQRMRELKLH